MSTGKLKHTTGPGVSPSLLAIIATSLLSTTSAWAVETSEYGMEISPIAGYRSGGSFEDPATGETLDLDESSSYGIVVNKDYDANTQWEFVYSRQDTELQLGPAFTGNRQFDLAVDYLSLGGAYIWRDTRLQPFIGAAVGVAYLDPQDSSYDSESRFLLQLSGGYKYFLTPNLGLRIEARGYATLMDTDAAIFCGNGACIARVESSGFGQVEINAGLDLRF